MQHCHKDVTLLDCYPPAHHTVSWSGLSLLLHCVPQIFENEYTRATNIWLYWVETALLVDWSDLDLCLAATAWASCCLFSVEQCLATFAWASCCLLFIITSGTSEPRFLKKYLPQHYHSSLLSEAIVPFLSLWDSLSPLLWNLSLGIFLRFSNFKGTLF